MTNWASFARARRRALPAIAASAGKHRVGRERIERYQQRDERYELRGAKRRGCSSWGSSFPRVLHRRDGPGGGAGGGVGARRAREAGAPHFSRAASLRVRRPRRDRRCCALRDVPAAPWRPRPGCPATGRGCHQTRRYPSSNRRPRAFEGPAVRPRAQGGPASGRCSAHRSDRGSEPAGPARLRRGDRAWCIVALPHETGEGFGFSERYLRTPESAIR